MGLFDKLLGKGNASRSRSTYSVYEYQTAERKLDPAEMRKIHNRVLDQYSDDPSFLDLYREYHGNSDYYMVYGIEDEIKPEIGLARLFTWLDEERGIKIDILKADWKDRVFVTQGNFTFSDSEGPIKYVDCIYFR